MLTPLEEEIKNAIGEDFDRYPKHTISLSAEKAIVVVPAQLLVRDFGPSVRIFTEEVQLCELQRSLKTQDYRELSVEQKVESLLQMEFVKGKILLGQKPSLILIVSFEQHELGELMLYFPGIGVHLP